MSAGTAVFFNTDLMRRYDREGPRYTSYPTAMQFRDGIQASDYRARRRHQPGGAPGNALVAVRAHSFLHESLFLLRLQ